MGQRRHLFVYFCSFTTQIFTVKNWTLSSTIHSFNYYHFVCQNLSLENFGCSHSWVDSSVHSILLPQVRVPSTPFTHVSIYIWTVSCGKDENKPIRGRKWPTFKILWNNLAAVDDKTLGCGLIIFVVSSQCDQIGQFIGLLAIFKAFGNKQFAQTYHILRQFL